MKWLFVCRYVALSVGPSIAFSATTHAEQVKDDRFPLFAYLTSQPSPTLMLYTPSQLDPRQEVNQRKLATSSIRATFLLCDPLSMA